MTGPNWPDGEAPRRGMSYINPEEAMTPRDIERHLGELYNEHIRAEIARRKLNDHLLDCVLAYERAFVIATMDPKCPVPNRTDITVAIRDAWVRGCVIDEWEALEMAKTNLEDQDRYLKTLMENTSKMQTVSGHVKQAYAVPQSGFGR